MEAIPGRDCPSAGQCCVSRNLSAEKQFGVNSSYHYGVVDLPGDTNMRQTNVGNIGRPAYLLGRDVYTQSGGTLTKSSNPILQPLKIFQFIIGEFKFSFAHLLMNQMMRMINFTCDGTITKWIVLGRWDSGGMHDWYPDLQIWRKNS